MQTNDISSQTLSIDICLWIGIIYQDDASTSQSWHVKMLIHYHCHTGVHCTGPNKMLCCSFVLKETFMLHWALNITRLQPQMWRSLERGSEQVDCGQWFVGPLLYKGCRMLLRCYFLSGPGKCSSMHWSRVSQSTSVAASACLLSIGGHARTGIGSDHWNTVPYVVMLADKVMEEERSSNSNINQSTPQPPTTTGHCS